MQMMTKALAAVVAGYVKEHHLSLGKDLAIFVSSDANHYGADFGNTPFGDDSSAHERGTGLDREIISVSLSNSVDVEHVRRFTEYTWGAQFTEPGKSVWCGKFSVPFGELFVSSLMEMTTGGTVAAVPLAYSDTWTEGVLQVKGTHMGTTAPFSLKHWVGWCSIGFVAR